ncbi:hypothetical protein [Amnibacterium sp.]|uniref:hypothetical protein n=1 Tax=Amnibacterium sp. TaxID=1872496 RepID=UPI003F7BFA0B
MLEDEDEDDEGCVAGADAAALDGVDRGVVEADGDEVRCAAGEDGVAALADWMPVYAAMPRPPSTTTPDSATALVNDATV